MRKICPVPQSAEAMFYFVQQTPAGMCSDICWRRLPVAAPLREGESRADEEGLKRPICSGCVVKSLKRPVVVLKKPTVYRKMENPSTLEVFQMLPNGKNSTCEKSEGLMDGQRRMNRYMNGCYPNLYIFLNTAKTALLHLFPKLNLKREVLCFPAT